MNIMKLLGSSGIEKTAQDFKEGKYNGFLNMMGISSDMTLDEVASKLSKEDEDEPFENMQGTVTLSLKNYEMLKTAASSGDTLFEQFEQMTETNSRLSETISQTWEAVSEMFEKPEAQESENAVISTKELADKLLDLWFLNVKSKSFLPCKTLIVQEGKKQLKIEIEKAYKDREPFKFSKAELINTEET